MLTKGVQVEYYSSYEQ
uniref:Uncharacterized protein n=1 Tax=Anguilla anguilla TaxID=7936 RepID=A0A0E9VT62_ANGAN